MVYSRIPHIQINWDEEPSGYADNPDKYVFVVSYVYLLYYLCITVLTLDAGLLARRPATSTQVFLGFPVSTSEC